MPNPKLKPKSPSFMSRERPLLVPEEKDKIELLSQLSLSQNGTFSILPSKEKNGIDVASSNGFSENH